MASLKCLACGHNNKVGDESCASCSSSLNLRLCSACEAINANNAERCHSCGAQFDPEEKVLPAAWVAGAEQAVQRGRRIAAALWLVPVIGAAALAYYFYATPQGAAKHVAAAQAAPVATPGQPEASARAIVGKIAPASVPVVEKKNIAMEPKRAAAPVTHTRAGEAVVPPRVQPTPAAVSEPVERRVRVTHTKGEEAAPVEPVAAPAPVTKSETSGCAPSVAALGLCKGN